MSLKNEIQLCINVVNNSITFKQNKKRETFKLVIKNINTIKQTNSYQAPPVTIINQKENEIITNLSKEKIHNTISKVSITSDVPSDGDCGAHAISFSLKQFGIHLSTLEILNLLSIPKCKTRYQLLDEGIAAICDLFNKK